MFRLTTAAPCGSHPSGNGWFVIIHNDTSISVSITVYVSCAPGVTAPLADSSKTEAAELAAARAAD